MIQWGVSIFQKRQKFKNDSIKYPLAIVQLGPKLNTKLVFNTTTNHPDMEKGADAQTLSAEIFKNYGYGWIVEEYSPLYSKETFILWKYVI